MISKTDKSNSFQPIEDTALMDALNAMGVMARERGEFDTAETLYRTCVNYDPTYAAAYLNLGILSIFDVVQDVWQARPCAAAGCRKFLDEVIKFREGSYVHAFVTMAPQACCHDACPASEEAHSQGTIPDRSDCFRRPR